MLDHSKQGKFRQAATAAYGTKHAIRGDVEAATAAFRAARDEDRQAVKRGDLAPNAAKARAAAAYSDFQEAVGKIAAEHAGRPDAFRRAVVDAAESREFRAANAKGDDLFQEGIALLKRLVTETEIANRRDDLKASATPHGSKAPTVQSWLDVLKASNLGGDEAAVELARREIARLLPSSGLEGNDRARAESAIVRPGAVDPTKVGQVIAYARGLGPDELARQAVRARSLGDASAVVGFAMLAREEYARANGGPVPAWAHETLLFLGQAPDAVIDHLQTLVADEVRASDEAVGLIVAAAQAEADHLAELDNLYIPSAAELAAPKPDPDRPIGLHGRLPVPPVPDLSALPSGPPPSPRQFP